MFRKSARKSSANEKPEQDYQAVGDHDPGADAPEHDHFVIEDMSSGREIEVQGKPLTAQGGALEVSEKMRHLCVLMDSGQFFVSESHKDNPHVASLVTRAQQMDHFIDAPTLVSMKTVQRIYEITGTKVANTLEAQETKNQRELLRIIRLAAEQKSSDIHFIVDGDSARVRFRVDGIMQTFTEMMPQRGFEICGTAFSLCDISDANYSVLEYQGARISKASADLPINVQSVRLQWSPLAFGGRFMVARLLYTSNEGQSARSLDAGLKNLGYLHDQLEDIQFMRSQPSGINVIAGPVSSGKSTTLATVLEHVLKESSYERSCLTVEDPPEYVIYGAQQMPVTNAKTDEERSQKFLDAIRSALRSDPNILLVGEVRDASSARLAFQGAMTGTQVWTSLHASSAMVIIERLRDIGVEDYKLTNESILTGLIGQRLIRVICPDCSLHIDDAHEQGRLPTHVWERTHRFLKDVGIAVDRVRARGAGCESCASKGYVGRTTIAETLVPDEAFMEYVRKDDKLGAKRYWVRDMGGITMLMHALVHMVEQRAGPIEIEQSVSALVADDSIKAFVRDRLPKILAHRGYADADRLSIENGDGPAAPISDAPAAADAPATAPVPDVETGARP